MVLQSNLTHNLVIAIQKNKRKREKKKIEEVILTIAYPVK